MDIKEKLVELLDEAEEWADCKCDELGCAACPGDKMKGDCVQQLMVDRLISNGVTVQEWISVEDKYPNHGDVVLICTKDKDIHTFQWDAVYDGWIGDRYNFSKRMVTHWMPLPDAPKGE